MNELGGDRICAGSDYLQGADHIEELSFAISAAVRGGGSDGLPAGDEGDDSGSDPSHPLCVPVLGEPDEIPVRSIRPRWSAGSV